MTDWCGTGKPEITFMAMALIAGLTYTMNEIPVNLVSPITVIIFCIMGVITSSVFYACFWGIAMFIAYLEDRRDTKKGEFLRK